MQLAWIAVGLIILVGLIPFLWNFKKKRWEKISMANGDVMCVYRTSGDYWFRDRQNMTTFHRPNGRYVKASNHFTLMREEIHESQVAAIEAEILRLKAKEEGGGA